MKRYIVFALCSSFAIFDSEFDTQKAAKDFLSESGNYDLNCSNFVLYDTESDNIQYITVSRCHNRYIGNLYCSGWSSEDAREFKKQHWI